MRRLVRIVLAAIGFSLLTFGASTGLAGAPTTVFLGQTAINSSVCKDWKFQLAAAVQIPAVRARTDARTLSTIQRFNVNDGSDCLAKSYESRQASNIAAASSVQGYWKYMWFDIAGYNAGSIHVDVGMTITGSTATANWGPNCYFHWNPPYIFGGNITWCGVWNNGNWYTEPGTNYYIWVYPNVWATRSLYMRYCVEGQGVSCSPWGG